jgi:heat shock protein HspQ
MAAEKSGRKKAARAKSKVEKTASPVDTKAARKTKPRPAASARTTALGADTVRQVRTRAKKVRARRHNKSPVSEARFSVGDVVRHKYYPFRGVIFDIDPIFANTDEWWQSIPEKMRPRKNQPFYHLLAENAETEYIAYVSEQNLLPDNSGVPVRHPQVAEYFVEDDEGRYRPVFMTMLN